MTSQLDFFDSAGDQREGAPNLPEGFRYGCELISAAEEGALLARVRELPFRDFEFHGYTGKRRVVSFGWHYDFSARHLRKADNIPDFLLLLKGWYLITLVLVALDMGMAFCMETGPKWLPPVLPTSDNDGRSLS